MGAGEVRDEGELKPKSRLDDESVMRTQVLPRWGSVPLNWITHADVVWITKVSGHLGASRTRKALDVLSQCLRLTIRNGRLPRDPTLGVKRPHQSRGRQRFLTHAEVRLRHREAGCRRCLAGSTG